MSLEDNSPKKITRNIAESTISKESLNNIHSELKDGEEFFCNISDENLHIYEDQLDKRIGDVAYGPDGKPVKGSRPVFVKKPEEESKSDEDVAPIK